MADWSEAERLDDPAGYARARRIEDRNTPWDIAAMDTAAARAERAYAKWTQTQETWGDFNHPRVGNPNHWIAEERGRHKEPNVGFFKGNDWETQRYEAIQNDFHTKSSAARRSYMWHRENGASPHWMVAVVNSRTPDEGMTTYLRLIGEDDDIMARGAWKHPRYSADLQPGYDVDRDYSAKMLRDHGLPLSITSTGHVHARRLPNIEPYGTRVAPTIYTDPKPLYVIPSDAELAVGHAMWRRNKAQRTTATDGMPTALSELPGARRQRNDAPVYGPMTEQQWRGLTQRANAAAAKRGAATRAAPRAAPKKAAASTPRRQVDGDITMTESADRDMNTDLRQSYGAGRGHRPMRYIRDDSTMGKMSFRAPILRKYSGVHTEMKHIDTPVGGAITNQFGASLVHLMNPIQRGTGDADRIGECLMNFSWELKLQFSTEVTNDNKADYETFRVLIFEDTASKYDSQDITTPTWNDVLDDEGIEVTSPNKNGRALAFQKLATQNRYVVLRDQLIEISKACRIGSGAPSQEAAFTWASTPRVGFTSKFAATSSEAHIKFLEGALWVLVIPCGSYATGGIPVKSGRSTTVSGAGRVFFTDE